MSLLKRQFRWSITLRQKPVSASVKLSKVVVIFNQSRFTALRMR